MGYYEQFQRIDTDKIRSAIEQATPAQVERVLTKSSLAPEDLPVLFSPAADRFLETMAQKSAAITERRFGKVIQLYAPLYLSNECCNHCVYCGFSKNNDTPRVTLTPDQAQREGELLAEEGFRHLLLVSGESPRHVGYHYLTEIIRRMNQLFSSIALEIFPLDEEGYRRMGEAGVDALALYQETYEPALYRELHPKGPKRDFGSRLDAHDRAGRAGYRSLGIGSLLGLSDWRYEAVMLALHGRYLTRTYWKSRVAVSFPRMRSATGAFTVPHPVSDREMVQMLCGLRLVLPDAEMVVSTREDAAFRDNLIGLGVTRMSAGSKTNPGGYGEQSESAKQFEIEDARTPEQVAQVIIAKGHEPVWKDFDRTFLNAK